MLSHGDVWRGVDRLAEVNGLSPSGLARRAGLDPTTFNKSKRTTRDGRPRWPSTESLAKILEATTTSLADFVGLVDHGTDRPASSTLIPCVRLTTARPENFDAAGFPKPGLDPVETPLKTEGPIYAIDIDTRQFEPALREGDMVIVSPQLGVRRLDRIAIMTRSGQLRLGILSGRTANRVWIGELADPSSTEELAGDDVLWLSRCTWTAI